jgi:tetratricopeptide (TPR) repeat protein
VCPPYLETSQFIGSLLRRHISSVFARFPSYCSVMTSRCASRGQEQYKLARRYLERSLAIDEELQDKRGIITNLGVLIEVTIAQEDYAATDQYLERAVQLLSEQGNQRQASVILFNAGRKIYEQLEQHDMTTEAQEQLQQAHRYYERSLAVGQALLKESEIASILEALIEVTIAQEDYATADQYLERAVQLLSEQGNQRQASVILFDAGRRIYEQLKKQEAADEDEQLVEKEQKVTSE